jgi:hypothetical protein
MLPAVWSAGVGSPAFSCPPTDGATSGLVGGLVGGSVGVGAVALGLVVGAAGAAGATRGTEVGTAGPAFATTRGAAGATCGTNFAAAGASGATRGTNFAAGGAEVSGATRGTDFAAVVASATRGTDFAAGGADAARATRGTDCAAGRASGAACGAAAATLGRVGATRGDGGTFVWAAFHPDAGTAGGLHAPGAASARGANFPEGQEEPATLVSPGGWPAPTLREGVVLRVSNQRPSNKITTTPATIDISMSPLASEPLARLANA